MAGRPHLSILVPCYNEAGNIPTLVERLEKALSGLGDTIFELVLVDDGSTDGTADVAATQAEQRPWIVVVKHDVNKGLTEGWASALDASSGEYVLTMDADMQNRPEDVPALWNTMVEKRADLVQGWRETSPDGSKMRRILSRLFSYLLNFIFGMRLKDIKSGFILYRRGAFGDIIGDRAYFRYFQHFPTIAANARGYSIEEVPVVFDTRHAGQSFITNAFAFGFRALCDFPEAWRRYRGGRR